MRERRRPTSRVAPESPPAYGPQIKPLIVSVVAVAALWLPAAGSAHRNPCHRNHTCPAAYHLHRWHGLLCTSFLDVRLPIDKIVVRYGRRTYWCHR